MTDLFAQAPKAPAKPRRKAPADKPAPTDTAAPESSVEASVGALVATTVENPVAVFTDEQQFSQFYQRLKEETDKHVPDLSTDKGRRAIASLAFRVTKAKTALDKAGLGLTEQARATIATVNASRKTMTSELDALADEVRRPLTEWEGVEKARLAANAQVVLQLRRDAIVTDDDTAATVETRGRAILAMTFEQPQWTVEEAEQATGEQKQAVQQLLSARNRLAQAEAQAAELARLRAAEGERTRLAAVRARRLQLVANGRQAQREAAEKIERERQAEADRQVAAKAAEEERVEAARQEAAAAAAQAERDRERERAALRERRLRLVANGRTAQREAAHQRELKIAQLAQAERDAEQERQRKEAAEREAEREAQRQRERDEEAAAQAKRDREDAERRAAEEAAAKRARDQEHRRSIKAAARDALIELGVDHDLATAVVTAIVAGDVPHTTVSF